MMHGGNLKFKNKKKKKMVITSDLRKLNVGFSFLLVSVKRLEVCLRLEPLHVVLVKHKSVLPDDGSCVIRNMLELL
jgi:hypothetical protein